MRSLPFFKYTSCGNNFVIVDESQGSLLRESQISNFAHQAANTNFGVGCDNLLVVQRCNQQTLSAIAQTRGYWPSAAPAPDADYIFRMFEPNGEEALCCGNGLVCVARHLFSTHGITRATVMTEVPLPHPRVVNIGAEAASCWANLGHPRRTPATLLTPEVARVHDDAIDIVERISIQFRVHDLKPYSKATKLELSGYLVFTGEPHLVIFPDWDFSNPGLADLLFRSQHGAPASADSVDLRASFGSWLVDRIGSYLNTRCSRMFPCGINVNFARILGAQRIETRCFERGINRETLACGTGALAVAFVAKRLHGLATPQIDILPLGSQWHDSEVTLKIHHTANGWLLHTNPQMLFEGRYQLIEQGAHRPASESTEHSARPDSFPVALQLADPGVKIPMPLPTDSFYREAVNGKW